MVKNVFISCPMGGLAEAEIRVRMGWSVRDVEKILGEPVNAMDSYIAENPPSGVVNGSLWYLAKSLSLLSQSDFVYFCDGWENYRRCRVEHTCAEEYGVPIIERRQE